MAKKWPQQKILSRPIFRDRHTSYATNTEPAIGSSFHMSGSKKLRTSSILNHHRSSDLYNLKNSRLSLSLLRFPQWPSHVTSNSLMYLRLLWQCSGLQPDSLIPVPVRKNSLHTESRCSYSIFISKYKFRHSCYCIDHYLLSSYQTSFIQKPFLTNQNHHAMISIV